jgi:hypothetical protein
MSDMYTPQQWDYLKKLGLISLGAGSSIPIIKYLMRGNTQAVLPESLGYSAYLPVVGMDSEPEGVDLSKEMGRKPDKRSKKLKDFRPSEDYEVKEKKADTKPSASVSNLYAWDNLKNPYFLPGVVTAMGGPGLLSYLTLSKLLKDKRKRDIEDDQDIAREAFNKTLVETSASKLNNPVEAARAKAASVSEEIISDLDELSELYIEKKAGNDPLKDGVPWSERFVAPVANLITGGDPKKMDDLSRKGVTGVAADAVASGISSATKALIDAGISAHNYVSGTEPGRVALGIMGALSLIGGGIGTYHGLRRARAEDREPYESNRYLAEFLQRQQEQGSPIYVTPTPIPSAKKQENKNPIAQPGS